MNRQTVLLACAALLLGLIVAWQLIAAPHRAPAGGTIVPPTPAASSPSPAEPEQSSGHDDVVHELPSSETADLMRVAEQFMALYVAAATSANGDWQATFVGLIDEQMADTLASIDPGRVNVTKVTGAAAMSQITDLSVSIVVPTDEGDYTLHLYRTGTIGNEQPVVFDFVTPDPATR